MPQVLFAVVFAYRKKIISFQGEWITAAKMSITVTFIM